MRTPSGIPSGDFADFPRTPGETTPGVPCPPASTSAAAVIAAAAAATSIPATAAMAVRSVTVNAVSAASVAVPTPGRVSRTSIPTPARLFLPDVTSPLPWTVMPAVSAAVIVAFTMAWVTVRKPQCPSSTPDTVSAVPPRVRIRPDEEVRRTLMLSDAVPSHRGRTATPSVPVATASNSVPVVDQLSAAREATATGASAMSLILMTRPPRDPSRPRFPRCRP